MAYENLKSAIKQAIKQNGNQEITGSLLQSTLLNIVNTLGAGYKFLGFATPSTVPPTSEEGNLLYFATTPGNYSNFRTSTGNLVISTEENGIFFFTKNATESYWNSNKVFEIVQTTGEAEDKTMSQKVISTELNKKANKADMDVELNKKVNKADIDVELNKKFDKVNIAQTTGEAEDKVISQKAISASFKNLYVNTDKYLLKNISGVIIENNKCLRENYVIENNIRYSLIKIPVTEKYVFILNKFEKSSFYTNGAFTDTDFNVLETGKLGHFSNYEKNGGIYKVVDSAKYLIFSLLTSEIDSIHFVQGDYTPYLDFTKNKIKDTVSEFDKKTKQNINTNFGLSTENSLKSLFGSEYDDNPVDTVYEAVSIKNFIVDEYDTDMKSAGINRCIKYKAGQGIFKTRSEIKRQSISMQLDNISAKASRFTICVIIEANDNEINDILNNYVHKIKKFYLQDIQHSVGLNIDNTYKYVHKIKDNFYLFIFNTTCEAGYTETYLKKEFVLNHVEYEFAITDCSHDVTLHGIAMYPNSWNYSTEHDYSLPRLKDFGTYNIANSELYKFEHTLYNQWEEYGILAVGTSYMHPNSKLAELTAQKLGCKHLQNNGNVGGSTAGVVGTKELVLGSAPTDWTIGLSLTNAELKIAYDLGIKNGSWMNTAILGYENLIMKYICDDDGYTDSLGSVLHRPEGFPIPKIMIVLDGQNDTNQGAEPTSDVETQRSTWRGAWDYILTEIYKVNPTLKVIFLSNPGIVAQTGYEGLTLYEANKKIVEKWNLPYVDFVSQLGVINDYRKGDITIYKRDWGGNHYKAICAERMAQILANYLRGFVF